MKKNNRKQTKIPHCRNIKTNYRKQTKIPHCRNNEKKLYKTNKNRRKRKTRYP